MADNINILYIAKKDKNGKDLTESQLQELQDLSAPLVFNFAAGIPGQDESKFYISSFDSVTQLGKDYWKIIVYQLLEDTQSTITAIKKSIVNDYTNFSASCNYASIGPLSSTAISFFDMTQLHPPTVGSAGNQDEWVAGGITAQPAIAGYKFSQMPNYSLKWVMQITASTDQLLDRNIAFGMVSIDSYFTNANSTFNAGIWPISQSVDNAYDPSTGGGGDIAKRWGYNDGGWVNIPGGTEVRTTISGSVRADAMPSESVFFPCVGKPGSTGTVTLLDTQVTLSLDIDDLAQGFLSTTPTVVAVNSNKLKLIIQESAVDAFGNSLVNNQNFEYSDYDVLMNNALTARPNAKLMEVDYNQQPGGTVSSQLFASSSLTIPTGIGPGSYGYMIGYSKGGVGGTSGDIFTLEGVALTSVTGIGTGGRVDVTFQNIGGALQVPLEVRVSDPANASNAYTDQETVKCLQAALNAVSDTTGTGDLNNLLLERYNLFGFPPEIPVNILPIISGSARRASVPESNYTSFAIIDPRYNGCELKSVDYNFYTPMPSQSKGGIGRKYPKGVRSPLLKNKLLNSNVVEFLDGTTGSWDGDVSYGNTSCTDHRPIYFAHFETSFADPTFYGTTTFAIDSLIAVPTGSITKFNTPTAEIIDVNGSGDRLLDVASTFKPTREAAVIYNNPRRNFSELKFGQYSGSGDANYDFGSENTGSLIYTSLTTGSYGIEASATEFQFIGGNEYNRIGTTPTQSFRIPNWLKPNNPAPVVSLTVQQNEDQNIFMRGSMYNLHTAGAWSANQPLKYDYNSGVVPMLITSSYHYNSTGLNDIYFFRFGDYNLSRTTSNYGADTSVLAGIIPGQNGVRVETADGSPGRGTTCSIDVTVEGGQVTQVKVNQAGAYSNGWAFGDRILIDQAWLQMKFNATGGGSGVGNLTCSFNTREAFAIGSDNYPSSFGEDLGMMIMKGPVAYFQNLVRRGDPTQQIYLSLQAPLWGAMQTWNHATITGSVSSGSQKTTGSYPYEYSETGYAPPVMINGDGAWSTVNHPYPFVYSTPRCEQVTTPSQMTTGLQGCILMNQYSQFADIGDEGRKNPLNYWQQNMSASQLWNYEDQQNPFMLEIGDELRISYKVENKVFYNNIQMANPASTTIYTQDFTVVDFWQPAPSLISDWYADSDVPAAGGKNTMCLTMSALPEKGVYSPEEITKRYTRQMVEADVGNNGGAVFLKSDQYNASFTNQTSVGFGKLVSVKKLTSIADGDISGSVGICINVKRFPPSSSQAGMQSSHTYIVGTNQGLLDFGSGALGERSQSQAGGPIGDMLTEGSWPSITANTANGNLGFALSGSLPILDWEQSGPYTYNHPDPAFAYDRLIVHPDPRKLTHLIPTGSVRSVTLRKREETDDRVVLQMEQPAGELGIQTPSGDGYIIPNDLSPQQLLNVKTLIKELKAKNIFRKDSDANLK